MRDAQRERVKRIPSSHAKADETVALVALAQKTTQELHNDREPINPDEAVAVEAAAHAANAVSIRSESEVIVLCLQHGVIHARGSIRSPCAQKMIQECLDRKKRNRLTNPDEAVSLGVTHLVLETAG